MSGARRSTTRWLTQTAGNFVLTIIGLSSFYLGLSNAQLQRLPGLMAGFPQRKQFRHPKAQGGNCRVYYNLALTFGVTPTTFYWSIVRDCSMGGAEQGHKQQEAWLIVDIVETDFYEDIHFLVLEVCNNLCHFDVYF